MAEHPWQTLIDLVRPHVVLIMTPQGTGTGFLLYHSKNKGLSAIATAAHVVNTAHFWEEPIRLQHAESGKSTIIRSGTRAVLLNDEKDVAAVSFRFEELGLPDEPLTLIESDQHIRVGVEIGWLGFPAVARELCFFSGRVSAYLHDDERYLVDGVAINGVSGGPAFCGNPEGSVSLMGVLSAYIPNRVTGEVLPGLAVAVDVAELHAMVADFKSLEDAQEQQTPPADLQAVPSEEPPAQPPSKDPLRNRGRHPRRARRVRRTRVSAGR